MGIKHQFLITCDQQPLPLRCVRNLVIEIGPENRDAAIQTAIERYDWGVIKVEGRQAHYCPHHRPTHQPPIEEVL